MNKEIEKKYKDNEVKELPNYMYLCLEIMDSNNFFSEYALKGICKMIDLGKDMSKDVLKEFFNIKSVLENELTSNLKGVLHQTNYHFPANLHVTTYYRGEKKWEYDNKAVKDYVEDKEVSLKTYAIVVIPGRIVFSVVFTDEFINNPIPHITTLLGTYEAVDSNFVAGAIFGKDKEYESLYKDKFIGKEGMFISKNVFIEQKKSYEDVYFYVFEDCDKSRKIRAYMKGKYY